MIRFFVAGIRRTGTTLIRTTLDQHPEIRCYGECFTFGGRFKHARGEKNEFGYRRHLQSSKRLIIKDIFNRDKVVNEYLDQLYGAPDYKAIGFKLTYVQHQNFPMVLDYLKRHETKVIHIVRENVLKTLISRSAKKITGHSHTTKPGQKTPVLLREHKLIADLEQIDLENRKWQDATADMPYMQVTYEGFVANKQEELERMQDFLGVEKMTGLQSHLAKGNSDDLREVIQNYEAVSQILKGTRFEWCLTK